jgi:SAM-dependent methyltransferase
VDSADWDVRYAASDLVWGIEPNRFVVQVFAGEQPGRALDIGTGEGRNAIWLAGQGWRVTAVDFSPVAIARAHELADARGLIVDWVTADVRDYEPETGGFDIVVVAYLHLPASERAAVLAHATRALARGGRVLVVGHDVANIGGGVGGPQDPAILYTPDAIAAELSGLTILSAERARRPVSSEHGTADAIDTVVLAVRV